MSIHHHERVDTPTGSAERVVEARRFSPGQVIGGVCGIIMTIVGVVAVINSGVDSSLNEPLANSFGLEQSAAVGIAEIVLGLLILVGASTLAYRGAMGFFGAISLIAGVVIVAASATILGDIGSDRGTGWFGVIIGAVVIAASLIPSFTTSSERTRRF